MPGADDIARAPLAGVRIIDFSQVLAGPYGTRLLAEMGADVIKVEAPGGDMTRVIAAPEDRGMSGLYTWANVGKRNVCIDLTKDGGSELALELVREAQLVVENFRPGVAERLGVGWEAIHRANPRAVMLSVSGYGDDSSRRDRGAYAPTIQAAAGLVEYQSRVSGQPMARLADARADITTALHGVIALLGALRSAEATGQGQHVEVSLYDSALASYSETPHELLESRHIRDESPPFNAGKNGWIVVAGPLRHIWRLMFASFEDLEDPAGKDADIPTKARLRQQRIEDWMDAQPNVDVLLERLESARLPSARVESLAEALEGDFARERELLVEVDDRRGGTRPIVRSPYRFSISRAEIRAPAPRRGEHNQEVLQEILKLSAEEIRALEDKGILCAGLPDEP